MASIRAHRPANMHPLLVAKRERDERNAYIKAAARQGLPRATGVQARRIARHIGIETGEHARRAD
jgi:hypothetical protein